MVVHEVGGDGTGTWFIPSDRHVSVAQDQMQTHLRSKIYNEGIIDLPPTVYVEQNFTTLSEMTGALHMYTRGYSRFRSSGSAQCSNEGAPDGYFFFHTFNVLDGGKISFLDESSFDVTAGMVVITDLFHMEGAAGGEISRSTYLMGRESQIEKQAEIIGSYLGYHDNLGPGAGSTCGCGTGGGYGGSGGRCRNRNCGGYSQGTCAAGAAVGSAVTPTVAGSGGGYSDRGGLGGHGGSSLRLVHQSSTLDGQIKMDGQTSTAGAGGGAGGAVWLVAEYVYGRGEMSADGGAGSDTSWSSSHCSYRYQGGGGGAGRIQSYGRQETSNVLLHQRSVLGGSSSYSNGGTGSLHQSHDNMCSGHGQWNVSSSSCECESGFIGWDCHYLCEEDATCSGNGICTDQGKCECKDNYVGDHCKSMCHRNTTCSNHGDCSNCGSCICDSCYHGSDCGTECSNHGSCLADFCECDSCHLGEYCESECNGHGTCNKETMACTCDKYWGGQKCTLQGCAGEDLGCSGHGVCNSATGFCYCDPGFRGT